MAAAIQHCAFKPHRIVKQASADIHMVHQEYWDRPPGRIDDPVIEADLAAFAIDLPCPFQQRRAAIGKLHGNLDARQRIGLENIERGDRCGMRGEGAMQGISTPSRSPSIGSG